MIVTDTQSLFFIRCLCFCSSAHPVCTRNSFLPREQWINFTIGDSDYRLISGHQFVTAVEASFTVYHFSLWQPLKSDQSSNLRGLCRIIGRIFMNIHFRGMRLKTPFQSSLFLQRAFQLISSHLRSTGFKYFRAMKFVRRTAPSSLYYPIEQILLPPIP